METIEKKIQAIVDETIRRKLFSSTNRDTLLDFILERSAVLPKSLKLSDIQIEVLEILVSEYRKLKFGKKKVTTTKSKKEADYGHYLISTSDQIPVGMFDLSRVEQY